MEDDRFHPEAIQISWLMVTYMDRLTILYGGYDGWIRQVGRPLNGTLDMDEEWSWQKIKALFFWAGIRPPIERPPDGFKNDTIVRPIGGWDALRLHVVAIREIYEHPEYWVP